jgi:hypothetical protein
MQNNQMLKQKKNFNRLSESSFIKKIKVSCQTAKLAKLPNQYMQNIMYMARPHLIKHLLFLVLPS